MLITTDVELGLLSDVDLLLFCEKAIRGGLNGVGALRHFRANNKDLNGYNKDQKSVYGAFLDVTSLYGGIMMKNCQKTDTSGLSLLQDTKRTELMFFEVCFPTILHYRN